jgi:hypothetical protein
MTSIGIKFITGLHTGEWDDGKDREIKIKFFFTWN